MTSLRIVMPLTDAFGGHGGIALYNRDVLAALSDSPRTEKVIALPRVAAPFDDPLPAKVEWRAHAAGSPIKFLGQALRVAVFDRPTDLIWCAHVNLLPIARALQLLTGGRIVLAIYGVEAWQPFQRRFAVGVLDHVSRVVAISDYTRDRFLAWSKFDPSRVSVVANAIDLTRYADGERSPDLIERYDLRGRQTVMILGRMHPTERLKGFDELLEALPAIRDRRPSIVALFVGDGEDRPRLEAKARSLGLCDVVRFVGRVDEAEKAAHYRLADAYAMPSRQEGFGFVHLEAMASGTPTVASSADGSREAVCNGAIGRLVDPLDRESIVREVISAIETPRGVPAGLSHFAYPRFAAEIEAVLAEVSP